MATNVSSSYFRELLLLPERIYEAGEVIIREEQPSQGIFFLMTGIVEISKGGTSIAQVSETGSMYGEISYLLTTLPIATVTAVNLTRMRVCRQPSVFLKEHPNVSLFIATNLAERLNTMNRYIAEFKSELYATALRKGFDESLGELIEEHAPR